MVTVSMVTVSLVADPPEVAVRELPPEVPSVVAGGGLAAAGADGSPSRDRLVRIAVMIRHAEQAMPPLSTRHRGTRGARLIPLAPRRNRAGRHGRRAEITAVLAS